MSKKVVVSISLVIFIIAFIVILKFDIDINELLSSAIAMKRYLLKFGVWTPVVFFVIQTLQVIIAPIPGNVTGLASGALFGIYYGFLLSSGAIILGSILAFYLSRIFGKPLVYKFVNKEKIVKYEKLSSSKFSLGLFILFLLPFFPDDILCLMAGLSAMPFSIFIILVIVGRLPGVFVTNLAGAGVASLNFFQLAIIFLFYMVILFLFYKYNHRFHNYIEHKLD